MNLLSVHLNTFLLVFTERFSNPMIRTIDCKIKKTIKHLLILVFCFFWTINSSFLSLQAQSTNHNHQTFTGGRLEYEINTYDSIQDINVDGTTFRATGIIILNYYLTNMSTGTLRFYFTGFNSNVYQTMNIYTYGATISNVVYSGANPGITFKINNPVDHVFVVITFTSTDMNSTLQNLTPSTGASLTTASSTDTTVQDIDVKLSGISSTLQQILTLLGSGNVSITDYLDDISAYSEYLEDIQVSLSNIDDEIDTISWKDMPAPTGNYLGYTTDFVTYDTTVGYKDAGYFVYEAFRANDTNNYGIYKIKIPLGGFPYVFSDFKFYTMYNNNLNQWDITQYVVHINRDSFVLYFTINDSYHNWPNGPNKMVIQISKRFYKYAETNTEFKYILPDDIEYWTLYQAMQNRELYQAVKSLVQGASQSDITDQIDDKISELNDVTQQSQTIENQQINNLDSFNNQIDLDDYNFNFNSRNGIEYFKLKLTDIYDIDEFKPFYLIPIVLFVLMALLRG